MHFEPTRIRFVYFMARNDGLVKIGVSDDPDRRLKSLRRNGDGLRLIGAIPGNRFDEMNYHARYEALRVHGEWFRMQYPLDKFLARLSVAGVADRIAVRVLDRHDAQAIRNTRDALHWVEDQIREMDGARARLIGERDGLAAKLSAMLDTRKAG